MDDDLITWLINHGANDNGNGWSVTWEPIPPMSQFHAHEIKLIKSAWLYLHFFTYVKLWMMFAIKSQPETKVKVAYIRPPHIGASHLMTLGWWKKMSTWLGNPSYIMFINSMINMNIKHTLTTTEMHQSYKKQVVWKLWCHKAVKEMLHQMQILHVKARYNPKIH